MKRTLLNQSGFSLLEALISAAILVSATLAAMSLTTFNSRNAAYDQHMVIASQLAANILEDLNVQYFLSPNLTTGTHTNYWGMNQNYLGSGATVPANTFYTATWTVTQTVYVKNISLTISWSDLGVQRQVTVTTLRGKAST